MATWTAEATNANTDGDAYSKWDPVGTSSYLTAIATADGGLFARHENHVDNIMLWGLFDQTTPSGTITSVKLKIRWRRTASGLGKFNIGARIGVTTLETEIGVGPVSSWDYHTSTALSRPGGGSWSWSDFAGTYFGVFTQGNGGGSSYCYVDYMQLIVTYTVASNPPDAAFTYDTTTGAAPLTVDFTDNSTQSPTSWAWNFGDSHYSTAQSPEHAYTSAGVYTVTLTATNDDGSDSTVGNAIINVQAATSAVAATFTGAPLSGAFPLLVNFYDGATGTPAISSWGWYSTTNAGAGWPNAVSHSADRFSTVQNATNAFQNVGSYTIGFIASNTATAGSSASATRSAYVVIVDGRPQPTIDEDTTTGTRPFTVSFTGSANNPATAWQWNFGDGLKAYVQSPTHTYTAAGTYTVSLSAANANGQLATSVTQLIHVGWIPPTADFNMSLNEGPEPLLVRFTQLSTGDITAYAWDFGDSQTSSLSIPVHTYTQAGTYVPTLTVSGTAGVDTATGTGVQVVQVVAGGDSYAFANELQEQLMSGDGYVNPCNAFTEFGGVNNVWRAIYERTVRFVMETGILQKEATLAASVSTGVYPLPADLIEIRRVEVDGVPLRRVDPQMMDYDQNTWESDTGDFIGYIWEPSTTPLTLTLSPLQDASTSVKVLYVYAPTEPTVPATCTSTWDTFPLPGMFWWVVKYGTYADLLGNEGDMYDPERAKLCEQIYQEGVQMAKLFLESRNF